MAVIWIFSLVLSGSLIDIDSVSYNNWELLCSPKWTKKNAINSYLAALFCFWLPSTILLISNITIIWAVRHLNPVASGCNPESGENQTSPAKDYTKTLWSLYILVIVYFLCVAPYFLAKFSFITRREGVLPPSMMIMSMLLMFASSAINPFIYVILRKEHRSVVKQTLKMISDKSSKLSALIKAKYNNIISHCCEKSN